MGANQLFVTRPDFLSPDDHKAMMDHALASEGLCVPSGLLRGDADGFRKSLQFKKLGRCRQIIRDAFFPLVEEFSKGLGVDIGGERRFDATMNAHTDGAFYKPHIDMGGDGEQRTRVLSAVYHFFRTPAAFSGGELRIYRLDQPGQFVDVPAVDNQLIVFPSMIPHEVRPVSVPSGRYADARFGFNLWVHKVAREEMS